MIFESLGATLNLPKYFFKVISATFLQSGAPVNAVHDESWYIDFADRTDSSTQGVNELSVYTPFKSLSTIQGICKKQYDQFEVQLEKAPRLTRMLACSNISEKCVFIHCNLCLVACIVFPHGVCHLTNTQLHNLQKKYIPTVLNKTGFPRTTHR